VLKTEEAKESPNAGFMDIAFSRKMTLAQSDYGYYHEKKGAMSTTMSSGGAGFSMTTSPLKFKRQKSQASQGRSATLSDIGHLGI